MLSVLSIEDFEKWNKRVRSFKQFDVYYLANYVSAFKLHGDGEPLLIYYENEGTRAMNVVMKRDISQIDIFQDKIDENTLFDFATPYGFGGFLSEGNMSEQDQKQLDEEYSKYCIQENIVSEVVRFHPVLQNSQHVKTIYDITTLGKTITIELLSHECIQSNLTKSNKYKINKARKNGVVVKCGWNAELIEEFIALYNKTMQHNEANNYYFFKKDFYENVLHHLSKQALIFYAQYGNEKIAMAIILYENNQLHYHLSALNREYGHLRPMNLLLFEVAKWGSNQGYKTFHLGGGLGSQEDNLFEFKRSFNKHSTTIFEIGKKIFLNKQYNDLEQIRHKIRKEVTSFFPVYRG